MTGRIWNKPAPVACISITIIMMVFVGTGSAVARTLWSGSFVDVSRDQPALTVSVNYPRPGAGRICGIELKSHTMILNKRVWQRVADGLVVKASYEKQKSETPPLIETAEGPRLSYLFSDPGASYGTFTIETRSGMTLADFFSQTIGLDGSVEPVIAVARECPGPLQQNDAQR